MTINYTLSAEQEAAVTAVVAEKNRRGLGAQITPAEYLANIVESQLNIALRDFKQLVVDHAAPTDLALLQSVSALSAEDKAAVTKTVNDLAKGGKLDTP